MRTTVLGNGWTRHARQGEVAPRPHVCADCVFAQVFAVQPRTLCAHPAGDFRGRVVPADRPGCLDIVPRLGPDFGLHAYASPAPRRA
jgi:hypothetical protein